MIDPIGHEKRASALKGVPRGVSDRADGVRCRRSAEARTLSFQHLSGSTFNWRISNASPYDIFICSLARHIVRRFASWFRRFEFRIDKARSEVSMKFAKRAFARSWLL